MNEIKGDMKEYIDGLFAMLQSQDCYDKMLMEHIEIISIEPIFKCVFRAEKEMFTNVYKSVHGTIYAGLVDMLGGIAISLADFEEQKAHLLKHGELIRQVSSDINISYVSSAFLGDRLYCEARLLKKGKNLAFTQVDIYNDKDMSLLATGRHTKFLFKAKM